MNYFVLKTHTDNTPLFSGYYTSFTLCLEDAISQNIDLSYIDLKHRNLSNANLDNANMPHANFIGANITGANMSESNLKQSIFHHSSLYNACLSYSNLESCDFRYTDFGATLINGCTLNNCMFSTLSCFDLDFQNADTMHGCIFESIDGSLHMMSKHPIVLKGLMNTPIIILDQVIKISEKIVPKTVFPSLIKLLETTLNPSFSMDKNLINNGTKRGVNFI